MTAIDGAALRRAIVAELDGNLLPFWRRRAYDRGRGRFVRHMTGDGEVRDDAPLGLILTTRLVWTFAALTRARGDESDLELARSARRDLDERLRDEVHGGFLFRVGFDGEVLDGSKKTYGQAFAIYALSELHLATGDAAALSEALELYRLVEEHAHDDEHGGYVETLARDWAATPDLRLSDKDLDAAKSMNAHLHVLEAYANLYRAWPDRGLATRLRELLELFATRILAADGRHLMHFFDEGWQVLSEGYTYGHDIEAAWLLCEAAAALGDSKLEDSVARLGVRIADAVLEEGLAVDGGLAYEGREGRVVDPNREWWCQAEAVVGFWQAFEASGEARFAAAAARVWDSVEKRVVDRRGGEWFWRVRPDGSVDTTEPKVSEWKGPYHNVRMCLEMMRRIEP